MPIIKNLDVFAWADSNTDEARAFQTYLGYVSCLAGFLAPTDGKIDYYDLLSGLDRNGALSKLGSVRYRGDGRPVQDLLISAWLHELHLYIVDQGDIERLRI